MSVTAPPTIDQLREQRHQLADRLREQERAAAERREQFLRDGSGERHAQFMEASDAAKRTQRRIDELRDQELELVHRLAGGQPPAGAALTERLSDPAVADELAKMAHSTASFGNQRIGEIDRAVVASWTGRALAETPGAPSGTVTPPGGQTGLPERAIAAPAAPPRFLDLVRSETLDQAQLPYAQETRTGAAGAPAPSLPGAVKPAVDFTYEDRVASPATIAGWTKILRQTIADVPQLQSLVQTRLTDELRRALETEVLSGSGEVSDRTGQPGIVGLLNTNGIASVPAGASLVDAVLDGMVAILAVGGVPNFAAFSLVDWATVLKTRGDDGAYLSNPFGANASNLWQVLMTPCMGVPAGKVIVGDSTGMSLLIRENAQIRVSDSDQDDLLRNRVTLLAELRAGLAVWIPSYFAVVETGGNGAAGNGAGAGNGTNGD